MDQIISSIKSQDLNHAFSQNLVLYFKHLINPNKEPENIKIDESLTYAIFNTELSQPVFNGTLILHGLIFDEVINKTDPIFVEKNLPYQLWLSPEMDRNEFKDELKQSGFRYIGDSIGQAIEIESMSKEVSYPKSLYIEQINSQERFNKWVKLTGPKFNYRGDGSVEYTDRFKEVDFSILNRYWRKYLGWLNGEPVIAGTLILGGGIAVIYDESIAIHLKNRKYGIDNGFTLKLMQDALKLGYKIGATLTTVGEIRRFLALGFSEINKFAKFIRILPRKR